MKRILPILLVLFVTLCAFAAPKARKSKPDLDQIRKEVSDPQSQYYYPKLMQRYEQNETVMTLDDYRRLYFGYMFEEDFNPYRHTPHSHKVEELYYKSHHNKGECDSIIKYAGLVLQDNPFDLQQIDYMVYALQQKKKNNLARIWLYRLNHLIEAIVSTGTGHDKENAWYVINPQHEYFVLNRLGRVVNDFQFEEPGYDHIKVNAKGKENADYYFYSLPFLTEYRLKYPEEDDTVEVPDDEEEVEVVE